MPARERSKRLGGRDLSVEQDFLIHNPLTIEQICDEVRFGKRGRFPQGTFKDAKGNLNLNNIERLTKYLVEEILIPSEEYPEIKSLHDLPGNINISHFRRNKLTGIVLSFGGSAFNLIKHVYPVIDGIQLKDYYIKDKRGKWFKNGIKNFELAGEATREFIGILMKKYGWTLKEIPEKICHEHFEEKIFPFGANLCGMMDIYNCSPVDAIINAYPEIDGIKLKPYYFHNSQIHTWTNRDGTKNYYMAGIATRELIEGLIKKNNEMKMENLPKWIRFEHFQRTDILPFHTNLEGMMVSVFKGSPYEAIVNAYPRINGMELKPYYFSKVPDNTWVSKDGVKNYYIIAQATNEFFFLLSKKYDIDFIKEKKMIRSYHFFEEIMPFESSLGGMFSGKAYNSKLSDFLQDFPKLIAMVEERN